MRKMIISFLLALMFFACSWEIPKGIHVEGKVGIEDFTFNYNLGDEISEEISKAIKDNTKKADSEHLYDVTVLECPNATDVFTYIIHLNVEPDGTDVDINQKVDIDEMVRLGSAPLVGDAPEPFTGSITRLLTTTNPDADADEISSVADDTVDDMEIEELVKHGYSFNAIIFPPDYKDTLKEDIRASAIEGKNAGKSGTTLLEALETAVKKSIEGIIMVSTIRIDNSSEPDKNIIDAKEIEFSRMELPDFFLLDKINFEESGFKAKMYLSIEKIIDPVNEIMEHSNLFKNIDIKLIADSKDLFITEDENWIHYPHPSNPPYSSNIDLSKDEYLGTSLPGPQGLSFEKFNDLADMLFKQEGVGSGRVNLKIKVRMNDQDFIVSDFDGPFAVKAEIVIWLPLSIAVEDTYEFIIPLDNDKDLFDRKDQGDLEYLEYIKGAGVRIEFDNNIFPDSEIIIKNKDNGVLFKPEDIKISGKVMEATLNSDDLDLLNNDSRYYPFIPEITLIINPGGRIDILKELSVKKLTVIVDVDYRLEF